MFEHVGLDRCAEYFTKLYGLLPPEGRLLNHGISRPAGRVADRPQLVHRPLRVPRRRAARGRHRGLGHAGAGLRGARRRVAARALRPHAAGVGRQPRGALGRGRRRSSVRTGRGSGACTWRRRRSTSRPGARASTRCWPSGRRARGQRHPAQAGGVADQPRHELTSTASTGPSRACCSYCGYLARSRATASSRSGPHRARGPCPRRAPTTASSSRRRSGRPARPRPECRPRCRAGPAGWSSWACRRRLSRWCRRRPRSRSGRWSVVPRVSTVARRATGAGRSGAGPRRLHWLGLVVEVVLVRATSSWSPPAPTWWTRVRRDVDAWDCESWCCAAAGSWSWWSPVRSHPWPLPRRRGSSCRRRGSRPGPRRWRLGRPGHAGPRPVPGRWRTADRSSMSVLTLMPIGTDLVWLPSPPTNTPPAKPALVGHEAHVVERAVGEERLHVGAPARPGRRDDVGLLVVVQVGGAHPDPADEGVHVCHEPTAGLDDGPLTYLKIFTCGPPPGPAPVMISSLPSPSTSPVATHTPPWNAGSYAVTSRFALRPSLLNTRTSGAAAEAGAGDDLVAPVAVEVAYSDGDAAGHAAS